MPDPNAADSWVQQAFGVHPSSFIKAAVAGAQQGIADAHVNQTAASPPPQSKLPQPMWPDCRPVHGKVRGPENHLLCITHGHILDVTAKTIIAFTLDEYNKSHAGAAPAAGSAHTGTPRAGGSHGGTSHPAAGSAADDQKRKAFHKSIGLLPKDIMMTVTTVDGPTSSLDIRATLTNTCTGPNFGEQGFARLQPVGTGGLFIAKQVDIPPIGKASFEVNATMGDKIPLQFTTVDYDVSKGGALKLDAVERPMTGSRSHSSGRGTSSSDTKGRNVKGGAEVEIKVVKLGGEYEDQKSHTEGSTTQDDEGETDNVTMHSAVYDVTVSK